MFAYQSVAGFDPELFHESALAVWPAVKAGFRARFGEAIYDAWFAAMELEHVGGGVAVLSVPTRGTAHFARRYYADEIRNRLAEEVPDVVAIEIWVRDIAPAPISQPAPAPTPEPAPAPRKARPRYGLAHFGPPIPHAMLSRKPTVHEVINAAVIHYGIERALLVSHYRKRPVVRQRQVAMFVAHELTTVSMPQIGRLFGGRDHTTVLHAVRKIDWLKDHDETIAADVAALKRRLGAE